MRLTIAKVRVELGEPVGADLPDVVIAGQHDDRHALLFRRAQLFDQRLVLGQPSLIGDVPQQQHDVGAAVDRVPQERIDDLQVIGLQRIDDVGIPERRVDMEVGRSGNLQGRPVFFCPHSLLGRRLRAQDGQSKAQQPCSNPFHLRTPFQKSWSSVSWQAPAARAQAFSGASPHSTRLRASASASFMPGPGETPAAISIRASGIVPLTMRS